MARKKDGGKEVVFNNLMERSEMRELGSDGVKGRESVGKELEGNVGMKGKTVKVENA